MLLVFLLQERKSNDVTITVLWYVWVFVECSYIFLMTLELRYILQNLNYVRKLHHNTVIC